LPSCVETVMPGEVILSDAQLQSALGNPQFRELFPFATQLTKEISSGCNCRNNRQVMRVPDFERIRQAFVNASMEDKRKLKQFYGGATIVILTKNAKGESVKYKFV